MAAFPSYGILLSRGFKEQRDPVLLRSNMEAGVAKQRPKQSQWIVARPVVYRFTAADYQSFVDWVEQTINMGADWFDWTDPRTSTVKQARIVNGDISDATPVNSAASRWDVAFTLETVG